MKPRPATGLEVMLGLLLKPRSRVFPDMATKGFITTDPDSEKVATRQTAAAMVKPIRTQPGSLMVLIFLSKWLLITDKEATAGEFSFILPLQTF